jgi:Cu(I)/Ag(I) efflux system periplasmic protein CusF
MQMNIAILATAIAAASLLAACSQPADPAADDANTSAAGMEMPMPEHAEMSGDAAAEMKMASASGTIESIDAGAGRITIKHGPVEALNWPGMTMAFKATPEQIASVEVGQSVHFEFESTGMDGTITRITAR